MSLLQRSRGRWSLTDPDPDPDPDPILNPNPTTTPNPSPTPDSNQVRVKVVLETLGKAHNERLLAALRDAVTEVYIETDDHYTRFDTRI